MKRFEGKNVLVTGAGRGIGRAVAVAFAKEGANVVINYAGREESALETLALCREAGGDGICVKADVSNEEECKMLFDKAKEAFGDISVLVNNAGITRDKLLIGMTEADFMSVMEGAVLFTNPQSVLPGPISMIRSTPCASRYLMVSSM